MCATDVPHFLFWKQMAEASTRFNSQLDYAILGAPLDIRRPAKFGTSPGPTG
jgi:hypothetical protein